MKKAISVLMIAFVSVAIFSGCSKTIPAHSSPTGIMTATEAGVAFSSANCYERSTAGYYNVYGVSGSTAINLNIKSTNLTTGSYHIDSSGTNHSAGIAINGNYKKASTGTISVTTINAGANMIGSFNFTCTDGTVVSGSYMAVF